MDMKTDTQLEVTDGFHLVIDALKLNGIDTIYGLPGIVWVLGLALSPLVLLPTRAALEAFGLVDDDAARFEPQPAA